MDGHFDYIETKVDDTDAPPDAIYVAVQKKNEPNEITVKDETAGKLESKHTHAGWKNPKYV